jgi:DNA polymerase-3 subunit epsilon
MRFLKRIPWLRQPHEVLIKNRDLFAEFNQGGPLDSYVFVVCDTELTGLSRRKDEIVSIGAVKIINLQIELSQTFYALVKPRNISPNEATLVHRITPEELETASPIDEVLPLFIEFLGNALLVGHFVGIDVHFLNKACRDLLGGTLSNPNIDTMRLARAYKVKQDRDFYGYIDTSESYNLDNLSKEFNLPLFKPHNALEDALQTAYLFLFLLKKMRHGGASTLKKLYRAGRSF